MKGLVSIEVRKPAYKQPILYIGNLGLKEGVYMGYNDGVGWCLVNNGSTDCFDKWKADES